MPQGSLFPSEVPIMTDEIDSGDFPPQCLMRRKLNSFLFVFITHLHGTSSGLFTLSIV